MSELKKRLKAIPKSRMGAYQFQISSIREFCREVFNREFMKNKSTRDTLIEVMRELGIEL